MSGLEVRDVRHAYDGVPSLRGVTLAVGEGEIVSLLGPSGCGKSTLLRVAAGLERLAGGSVSVGGREVAAGRLHVAPERRGVGMVFQDFALFPHLTVAANVAFGLSGRPGAERRSRVEEALRRVGMEASAARYPHQLSGGEQQRVALARALAPGPAVMLLDEPFSGLDAEVRRRVREETRAVLERAGAATLLVTHDAEEAMQLGDRIALLSAGALVQVGSAEDLFFRPADEFAARFLGETTRLDGVVAAGRARTPFGEVDARGFADGDRVAVVVRHEGVRLRADDGGSARVLDSRLAGGRRRTTVAAGAARLVSSHDVRPALRADTSVAVDLVPEMVHVFAADGVSAPRRRPPSSG
ncbi:MAG: ABC transporter ATP-binding protein [Planctomycetota bacterium JB042]